MKWQTISIAVLSLGLGAGGFAQEAADKKGVSEAAASDEQSATDKKSAEEKEAAKRAEEEKISDAPIEEIETEIKKVKARIKGSVETADFPALEKERRIRLVRDLAAYPHPSVLKALEKIFKGRNDASVRGAAAWAMGKMKFERKKVARVLCSRIKSEWKNADVLIGIAAALGELREAPDRKAMYSFFNHPADPVYVSMIDCLGEIRSNEDLPKLHDIFSQYAKKSTAGVSVRVDTGTAGGGDQASANAKGRGSLKKAKVVRREGALHATQQAVKKLTGQDFDAAGELWDWMKEREKELGLKLRKNG